MTSKERSHLMSLAQSLDPVLQIGKNGLTPETCTSADEALEARELIKINVLKNCFDDIKELSYTLAGRTRSEVVQVIGRKVVLYRRAKDPANRKIVP